MTLTTPPSYDRLLVDLSLLIVRIGSGVVFAFHGAQKMWGWFDGPGLSKTVEMMNLGPLGYLVCIGEFFGGVGLLLGFLTRFSAASLILIMIGAIAMAHGKNGFSLANGGFEYNFALICLLAPTLLAGPGRFSIGRLFLPKSRRTNRPLLPLE
jgi:putative oxidoreductase